MRSSPPISAPHDAGATISHGRIPRKLDLRGKEVRFASTGEVANPVVYLWSPAASGTRGAALRVKSSRIRSEPG